MDGTLSVSLLKMRNLTHIICPILSICERKLYPFFTRGKNFQEICLGNEDTCNVGPKCRSQIPRAVPRDWNFMPNVPKELVTGQLMWVLFLKNKNKIVGLINKIKE